MSNAEWLAELKADPAGWDVRGFDDPALEGIIAFVHPQYPRGFVARRDRLESWQIAIVLAGREPLTTELARFYDQAEAIEYADSWAESNPSARVVVYAANDLEYVVAVLGDDLDPSSN